MTSMGCPNSETYIPSSRMFSGRSDSIKDIYANSMHPNGTPVLWTQFLKCCRLQYICTDIHSITHPHIYTETHVRTVYTFKHTHGLHIKTYTHKHTNHCAHTRVISTEKPTYCNHVVAAEKLIFAANAATPADIVGHSQIHTCLYCSPASIPPKL